MARAMRYYPPNEQQRIEHMTSGDREREARTEQYKKAKAYYDGDQTPQLDVRPDEPDDNVVLNLVRMVADRLASYLFPETPKFQLDPDVQNETPEELWMREAWEANGGTAFLHGVAENGMFSGQNYVRIIPPDAHHPFPRLINIDPRIVVTYHRADDKDTVVWHELKWRVGEEVYLMDVVNNSTSPPEYTQEYRAWVEEFFDGDYFGAANATSNPLPDDIKKYSEVDHTWHIYQYRSTNAQTYELVWDQKWNFEYGPIYSWQHLPDPSGFYGRPSFGKDSMKLQDTVNLMFSEMARINRYHSSPRTIITGVDAEDVMETSIDHVWSIENPDARVSNLEMTSELEAAMRVAQMLYEAFLSVQRVVILRGEVKDFQRVTNNGVRTVFLDQSAARNLLLSTYGPAIINITARMTMVAGMGVIAPELIHTDPLPTDRAELVNTILLEVEAKILSKVSARTILGHDAKKEKERIEEETQEAIEQAQAMMPATEPEEEPLTDEV